MRGSNQLHTLEHLNAALGLFCFSGFGAETIDVTLQMCHALLLAFVHRLLLRQTGSALYFKGAVVTGVLEHILLFDMNDFIDDRIEKVTVVGDQDQCTLIALQPFFQPDNGIEIEVVCRFVEQQ